ncbi:MAG: recombination protein RecR [Fibrobacter sp.]|jgi:recombination protein RecR|nr:recombination protein RecR [Fibrobacter sp.]
MIEPPSLERLIIEFSGFPGIGKKTARRLAYHVLSKSKEKAVAFSEALLDAVEKVRPCSKCFSYAEQSLCDICKKRSGASSLCVVEKTSDILPFESSGVFQGLYFVLGGVLSPLDGVGPEHLHIPYLIERVQKENIQEVILALGSSPEAESTVLLIDRLLKDMPVKRSRLARGIPMGSDLEFVDEMTMLRAFEGRVLF